LGEVEAHIRKFVKILRGYSIERIVVESTGRYEHALVQACDQAGLPIIIVNPTSVIEQEVAKVDHWRIKAEILTSVPGVGKVLTYT
jgi:transposase